jgi:hypothetical protein
VRAADGAADRYDLIRIMPAKGAKGCPIQRHETW